MLLERGGTGPGGTRARFGLSPQPIETDEGWLIVYQAGVRNTPAGALLPRWPALLDLDEPANVVRAARNGRWPPCTLRSYGRHPNVVFPCWRGAARWPLRLYYGAADTCVGLMTAQIADVLDWLRTQPAPGQTLPDRLLKHEGMQCK